MVGPPSVKMTKKIKWFGISLLVTLLTLVSVKSFEYFTSKPLISKVQVNDIKIAYKVFGHGEPLILIMGYGATMDLWDTYFLEKLAQHYQVIVFDNRGMGQSTTSAQDFSMRLFADDTAGLMEALNIKKAHVLGWSMGDRKSVV